MQRPDPNKDELEFNDGMGDMLREKETLRFSWTKTMVVAIGIVAIVVIVFSLGFQLAKRQFSAHSQDLLKPLVVISPDQTVPTASIQGLIGTASATAGLVSPSAVVVPTPTSTVPTVAVVPVRVPVPTAKPEPAAYRYRVIAGSFKSTTRANVCIRDLKRIGVDAFATRVNMGSRGIFYRVQAGAYATAGEAQRAVDFLNRHGYQPFILN